jgi:site-specific DNA-methyltransferase (adenine-specific)
VKAGSKEGDTVLDPFLGTGTTAKAAKDLSRNYIGIEINPDYVKIAQDRLKQEVLL